MAELKEKLICDNKQVRHEYYLLETFEAGIELRGTEVKSLRAGKVSLKEAYAGVQNGQVFINNMHISPYEMGNRFNHDPLRPRRLLLHKSEINKIYSRVREKGLTLVPVKLYFAGSLVKMQIALAQGKKLHDKRDTAAANEAKRTIERALKEKQRDF
ncbi:MAG: SsrA-binding protein SmpB [Clostridia bacterium]|nr:SsrA-binding protein SmpB [Clostridia bacterium]